MVPIAPEGCLAPSSGWSGTPVDTARLRLRRLSMDDADAVARLLDDWDVVRNTSNIPFPYDREMAIEFVAKVESESATGRAVVFAVEDRLSHQLIGCVGSSIEQGRAEVGYWFGRAAWGRGYASEALLRFLRLLFEVNDIGSAWASVLPENRASRRVLDKAGFVVQERRRVELPARGVSADLDFLVLERADWLAARNRRPMLLVAAAALIDVDGRVLLAQRPPGKSMAGQWEFPGGKLNPGETPEAALVRELDEELGIDVSEACLAPLGFASHDYDSFHLLMPLFACRRWLGNPSPREGQKLAWAFPPQFAGYPMPPADLPLVAILRDWL
ncbi:bifunctional GNAT family N-acetyltransferase/(deoxy)nucleoside triphosphate pyrophosphohydrolase [Telmatospirillum sp.]|uniref:bifunctional GNAT family N-acetyltransferase/(deoxy)nucleoside triphosphate pyrophosphohydrolase n=1 Tax=Telmatospirillum sp. TaxID=2079197 RepID=UPI002843D05D|nr:bifunctional GNAT family N-acetyltransferase/(deoxy)nucleoside triphosphate pyrophosphohydrolase [Telmatospirillum sp.]MDR3437603.1 bifunctional GNAT family N-acetyltransferase/(deoxy)nucleoside triphosphate pyrophosphohydrolase [Telmatospirillum sp.]